MEAGSPINPSYQPVDIFFLVMVLLGAYVDVHFVAANTTRPARVPRWSNVLWEAGAFEDIVVEVVEQA